MSASFPTSVKTFTSRNAGDVIQPAHINDLQDEVNAVETALINGPIVPAGGSAAAPAYSFNGNTHTGVYASGTNALDFATASTKALGIDSAGFIDSPTQPRCQVFHGTTQSIPDSTETALLFNSEDHDVGAMHSTSVNTTRVTVPTGGDGTFLLCGAVCFVAGVGNSRYVYLRKNGSTPIGSIVRVPPGSAPQLCIQVSALVALAATDYIETIAFQDSGGALTSGDLTTRYLQNQMFAVKLW